MNDLEKIDLLFHTLLSKFFSIPARQSAVGLITFAQMRILWILEFRKSATLSEVAGSLGIRASTATELVDKLVTGKYISRLHSSKDRRCVALALLPKGRAILSDFEKRRRERFQKILQVLNDSDIKCMTRNLLDLNKIIGKWKGDLHAK